MIECEQTEKNGIEKSWNLICIENALKSLVVSIVSILQ